MTEFEAATAACRNAALAAAFPSIGMGTGSAGSKTHPTHGVRAE